MKRRIAIDLIADEVFQRLTRASAAAVEHPQRYLLRTAEDVEKEWEERTRRPGLEEQALAVVRTEPVPESDQIQAAVDALAPRQRQILGLHLQGLRYQQIATQLALADEVVLQDLVTVYSRLRMQLAEAASANN